MPVSVDCCIEKTGDQGCKIESTVEAILVFPEISPDVLRELESVKGSGNRVLEIAEDGIDPLETFHLRALSPLSDDDRRMVAANGPEAGKPVRNDGGRRIDVSEREALDLFA